MSGSPRWRFLAAFVLAGLAADQATKFLAVERLTTAFERAGAATLGQKLAAFFRLEHLEPLAREPYTVFRPWWRMNYVENPNAAFGLGAVLAPGPRYALFLAVAAVAVAGILWYYRRLRPEQWIPRLALAMVLTGTLGNVVDRLARRYVIDFVEWYWWNRPDLRWPTFNVADALLSVGLVLLLLLPQERKGKKGA
jgi:signal peptidase II